MKKLSRKLLAVFLSALLLISSGVVASASTSSTQTAVSITAKLSAKLNSIISTTLASKITNMINLEDKNDSSCPWNSNTVISDVIPTYNLNDTINGCIVNLKTGDTPTGYLMYAISTDNQPVLNEFGYNGTYSIQNQKVTDETKLGQQKLVHVQMDSYLVKKGSDIYTVNDTNVTNQRSNIQNVINQVQSKVELNSSIQRHIVTSTTSSQTNILMASASQVIYKTQSVLNLWNSGYQPVHMDSFPNWSHSGCTPVCATNMLIYWHMCRGVPYLYNLYDVPSGYSQTVGRLATQMGTINDSKIPIIGQFFNGTQSWKGYNGVAAYWKVYACTAAQGSDYVSAPTWDWLTRNIDHNIPYCLNASVYGFEGDTRTSGHSFFGVGYQDTSDGLFLRVGNEWDTSFSHFYNYTTYSNQITEAWYYRW